jgi:hypothetical protein
MICLQPLGRVAVVTALALVLVTLPKATADDSAFKPLLESCRDDGFDPWQLSCETCDLLPTTNGDNVVKNPRRRCLECCQTYKTSATLTKPYESAVLVHREQASDSHSEMAQFLDEHWNDLVATKGSKRLLKIVREDASMSTGLWFRRPAPQLLLWFDSVVSPGLKLKEYKETAKEAIQLDGYKKDEIRDMLTAMLPGGKAEVR